MARRRYRWLASSRLPRSRHRLNPQPIPGRCWRLRPRRLAPVWVMGSGDFDAASLRFASRRVVVPRRALQLLDCVLLRVPDDVEVLWRYPPPCKTLGLISPPTTARTRPRAVSDPSRGSNGPQHTTSSAVGEGPGDKPRHAMSALHNLARHPSPPPAATWAGPRPAR